MAEMVTIGINWSAAGPEVAMTLSGAAVSATTLLCDPATARYYAASFLAAADEVERMAVQNPPEDPHQSTGVERG